LAKRRLSAIFFDIDDTLYSTTEFTSRARAAGLRAMIAAGLPVSFEEACAEMDEIVREGSSNDEHQFDKLVLRLGGAAVSARRRPLLVAAGVVAYHDTKFRHLTPYEDALEVLKRLVARHSVRLGIISAGVGLKQAEKVVRLGLAEFFDPEAVFISDEVGIDKTNPKLYRHVCVQLALAPDAVMVVGDHPLRDVDPPNAVGMITVLHQRSGKYQDVAGRTQPDYVAHNFWDLWEILDRDFAI